VFYLIPASPSIRYSIGGVYLKYQRLRKTVTIPTGVAKTAGRSPGSVIKLEDSLQDVRWIFDYVNKTLLNF